MPRSFGFTVALLLLLKAGAASAEAPPRALLEKLEYPGDFRVRVQAALSLGQLHDASVLPPLTRTLDDRHASVRAAAAAALKHLGDHRALAALRRHQNDRSEMVRRQISVAIATLQHSKKKAEASASRGTRILVKLGSMKNGSKVRSKRIAEALSKVSRERLNRLPDVRVLTDEEHDEASAKTEPVVLVSGRVQRLRAARRGQALVYFARVEYVVERMPGRTILGKLSGSASAKATPSETRDRKSRARLRRQVLEAAVDSAIRQAPPAFTRATQL